MNIAAVPKTDTPSQPVNETVNQTSQLSPTPQEHQPFSLTENYTSKFFGLEVPPVELDFDNVAGKVAIIDQYVAAKIADGYLDSTETYQEIISNIKEMLGISDLESSSSQIDKIVRYLTDGKFQSHEFTFRGSSKAAELDLKRSQRVADFKNKGQFRRLDNLFTKLIR